MVTKIMVHEKKEKEGDKIMVHEKKEKGDAMENAAGAISAGERHGDFEKREKAVGGGQPCEYQDDYEDCGDNFNDAEVDP